MSVDLGPYLDAVPSAVVERIQSARRVLAVGHENPDADTLGATLAVSAMVEACGGRADPVCTDPIPELYDFLAGVERFRTDPDPDADYDLLVISDCGTIDRVGDVGRRHRALFERLPRVVLDHHASNDDERGPADWVDPDAAATCEMATLLAARLGVPLDTGNGALAAALMGGIVMDTATFAHPNATPRTLVVSAALVGAGAPLSDISRRLYRTKPERQLRLFGRVLDRLVGVHQLELLAGAVGVLDQKRAVGLRAVDHPIRLEQVADLDDVAVQAVTHTITPRSGHALRPSGPDTMRPAALPSL